MALARHTDGLRPIGEALGAVIVGLDRAVAKRAGKTVIQNLADTQGWEAPGEGTERYRMLDLALASRGMGYRFRGGEGAHDAWSLARTCAAFACERDCIDVSRADGVTEAEARMAMTQWGLTEVRTRHAAPGDLLLFQTRVGFHAAIMSAPGGDLSWSLLPGRRLAEARMIHAAPAKSVVESWVGPFWMEQLVAAFSFDTLGAPLRAAMRRAA